MKRLFLISSLLSFVMVGGAATSNHSDRRCTREEAIKAETESSSLKTWPDVFASYQRYAQCDDAAISEGYSASVADLLADHWKQFGELARITKRHPSFEKFVLHHLDDTMSSDQEVAIRRNVRSRCPKQDRRLCEHIRKRLDELQSP